MSNSTITPVTVVTDEVDDTYDVGGADNNDGIGSTQKVVNVVMVAMPVWLLSICSVFILLAITAGALSWLFVFNYRKKPIVAMGQPEFMYSICAGSLLLSSSLIFVMVHRIFNKRFNDNNNNNNPGTDNNDDDDTTTKSNYDEIVDAFDNFQSPQITKLLNASCYIVLWFQAIGYILIFSALLCKMYRAMKITEQPLRRGVKILPKHVMAPYLAILSTSIGLLITWTILSPKQQYIVYDVYQKFDIASDNNSNTNSYYDDDVTIDEGKIVVISGVCQYYTNFYEPSSKIDPIVLYVLYGICIGTGIILALLAYRIRNVNQQLGDSRRVFRLILFIVINYIVYAIIFFTRYSWRESAVVSVSPIFYVSVMTVAYIFRYVLESFAIIGFMIIPRIYFVWYENKHGHLPDNVHLIGGTGKVTVRGIDNNNGIHINNDNNIVASDSKRLTIRRTKL